MHRYKARGEKHYLKLLHSSKTADNLTLDLQAIERSETLNVSSFLIQCCLMIYRWAPIFPKILHFIFLSKIFTLCNQLPLWLCTQLLTIFHTKQVYEKNK